MIRMFRVLLDAWKADRLARARSKSRKPAAPQKYTVVLVWGKKYAEYNNGTPEVHTVCADTPWAAIMRAQLKAAKENQERVPEFVAVDGPPLLAAAQQLLTHLVVFEGQCTRREPGNRF
ncbi:MULTISPECIES: hypothetical protein [unclassified Streptomyces]|uniref:hypothetical protein n=1 Tax=unclassified Streptomyces TaxID=2593676 RepID=UPI0004C4BFB5|nr:MULTISPECIES: hypothetical protein [unclassified Streptomyces]